MYDNPLPNTEPTPPLDYQSKSPPLLGRARGEATPYEQPRQPHMPLIASVEVPGEMGSSKVQVFGHPGSGAYDRAGVVLRFTVCSEDTDCDLVPHAELRADGVDLHLVTTWEAANILQALAEALRIAAERTRQHDSREHFITLVRAAEPAKRAADPAAMAPFSMGPTSLGR